MKTSNESVRVRDRLGGWTHYREPLCTSRRYDLEILEETPERRRIGDACLGRARSVLRPRERTTIFRRAREHLQQIPSRTLHDVSNRYCEQQPGLKPTAGYRPKRWLAETMRPTAGIRRDALVRER